VEIIRALNHFLIIPYFLQEYSPFVEQAILILLTNFVSATSTKKVVEQLVGIHQHLFWPAVANPPFIYDFTLFDSKTTVYDKK
jgi:hypothetical protein